MPDRLDGTEILEAMASVGLLEAFETAVDNDDVDMVRVLLGRAGVSGADIAHVVAQMLDA